MANIERRDDGTQNGPGEQIRPHDGRRDATPLSTPGDGRPTEDDLAQDEEKKAPANGGDK